MTTLIQQPDNHTCALAAMAMALGYASFNSAWSILDHEECVKNRGVADPEPWLKKHGVRQYTDYIELYTSGDREGTVKALLGCGLRALLSVNSLNHNHGSHMVYWDGFRIWDPNEGLPDKLAIKFLSSVVLNKAYVFKEKPHGRKV